MSIRLSKENQIGNFRLRLNSAFHQEIMTVARGIAWPSAPNIKDRLQTADWTFNATRRQVWLLQAFPQATKKQALPQLTFPHIARCEWMGTVPDLRTVYSGYLHHMASPKLVCRPSPEQDRSSPTAMYAKATKLGSCVVTPSIGQEMLSKFSARSHRFLAFSAELR
jgi:hypothetical protein